MGLKGVLGGRKKASKQPNCVPATAPTAPTPQTAQPMMQTQAAWDSTKFKIHLKMAKNRVDIQRGKKENEIEGLRRVIAQHLSAKKETLARIQGERVLRERMQIAAFDILDTLVEQLASQPSVFATERNFDATPPDIKESTASIIYASSRTNVPELKTVVDMLRAHFGPAVVDPLLRLEGPNVKHVNNNLALSLQGGTPDGYLVLEELTRIAVEHNVAWIAPPEDHDLNGPGGPGGPGHPPSGGSFRPMHGTLDGAPHMPPSVLHHMPTAPPPQNYDYLAPSNIPGLAPSAPPFGGHMPTAPPPSAPHFDPAANASGTLYPYPSQPPPPPQDFPNPGANDAPNSYLSDDALEAKFRNVRDNYGKQ